MKRILTIETGIYFLIFILGVSIRMIHLGTSPLSDYEARWALSALQVSRGSLPAWSMIPLYEMFTGVAFFLGGANAWLARFLPAVVGTALVLSPALFRPWLGKRAALLCALGFSIDPALVMSSRLVGSPILAVTFSVFAAGFWLNKKTLPAAVCLALALLGGPHFWIGIIPLGLAALAAKVLVKGEAHLRRTDHANPDDTIENRKPEITVWIIAGAVFLGVGTMLFRFPQGLGAFAQGIPAYFSGWVTLSGIPLVTMALMLALFQPLALIFGLAGGIRAWVNGNGTGRWLSIWFLLALVITLLYPSRAAWELAWVVLPLWGLASLELEQAFEIPPSDALATLGQAALILVLFILAWLNFAGILITQPTPEAMRMRWILIAGVFVLGMLATVLVGMGWSFSAARTGLVWGVSLSLAMFVFSSTWAGIPNYSRGEGDVVQISATAAQWIPAPAAGLENLLVTTLGDLAERNHGDRRMMDVVVVNLDSDCETCFNAPSVKWALRNIQSVRYVDHLGKGEAPEVVITSASEAEPSLVQAYRGQSIGWWVYPEWQNGIPADWVRWVLKRSVPARIDPLVLWARSDIFPDAVNTTVEKPPAIIQPVNPQLGPVQADQNEK